MMDKDTINLNPPPSEEEAVHNGHILLNQHNTWIHHQPLHQGVGEQDWHCLIQEWCSLQGHTAQAPGLPLTWGYGASLGGPLCHTHNPILRLFFCTCLRTNTTSDNDQTRPHKKHKQNDKQHHRGVGAARLSSGVDLTNPCLPRGGRPSAYFFQCRF